MFKTNVLFAALLACSAAYAGPSYGYYSINLQQMGYANASGLDNTYISQGFQISSLLPQGNYAVNFASTNPAIASQFNEPVVFSTSGGANGYPNAWSGLAAARAANIGTGAVAATAPVSLTMDVGGPQGITQPLAVFTLMSTYWGTTNDEINLVMNFSDGSTYSTAVTAGDMVRNYRFDPNAPAGTNTINGTTAINVFQFVSIDDRDKFPNGATYPYDCCGGTTVDHNVLRLDAQIFEIPAYAIAANLKLMSITVQDNGCSNIVQVGFGCAPSNASRVLLWGASVATLDPRFPSIPEPGTLATCGMGLLAVLATRRLRRRAPKN